VYQPLIDKGYDIITMPLSAGISGTFLSASAAAGQFPIGRIEVRIPNQSRSAWE
jgi:fatty acid-binding protein DegV